MLSTTKWMLRRATEESDALAGGQSHSVEITGPDMEKIETEKIAHQRQGSPKAQPVKAFVRRSVQARLVNSMVSRLLSCNTHLSQSEGIISCSP